MTHQVPRLVSFRHVYFSTHYTANLNRVFGFRCHWPIPHTSEGFNNFPPPCTMYKLCSFSNLSVTSPTSQLILQPFRRFTYVTPHSPILPLLHLRHSSFFNPLSLLLRHRHFTYVTWRAAHDDAILYSNSKIWEHLINLNRWNCEMCRGKWSPCLRFPAGLDILISFLGLEVFPLFVFCAVLSLAVALTFYWPQTQGNSSLWFCLVF